MIEYERNRSSEKTLGEGLTLTDRASYAGLVRGLSSKRARCITFFLSGGIGIGAWAASLPLLSQKMDFDKGELGLLLLGFALGAIVLMVATGRFIDRLRSDYLSLAGSLTFGLCIFLIPFVSHTYELAFLVFIAGAGFGTLDVSMNTDASQLERETKRHLMSSLHAAFSVGNLIGAFIIGKIVSHGGTFQLCLGAAGIFVVLCSLATRLLGRDGTNGRGNSDLATGISRDLRLSNAQRTLILLFGLLAFMSMLAEGGMMDWTAIFLVSNLGAPESVGAYAFGIFAGAMAFGRFVGDIATHKIGHVNLIRLGGTICAISVIVMLTSGNITVTLVALAICGLGVANMVPAVFASAGHIGREAAGKAMSIVTTMGYTGLLLGPALLGFVAQTFNLTVSLCLIASAFALITVGSYQIKKRILRHGFKLSVGRHGH